MHEVHFDELEKPKPEGIQMKEGLDSAVVGQRPSVGFARLWRSTESITKRSWSFVGFGHDPTDHDEGVNSSRRSSYSHLLGISESEIEQVQERFGSQHARAIFIKEERVKLERETSVRFCSPTFREDFQKCLSDARNSGLKVQSEVSKQNLTDKGKTRHVHFGTIHMREFPIIPGNNPGGLKGVPFTIDWTPVSDNVVGFETYEDARAGHRRTHQTLQMTAAYRDNILRQLGFSRKEINQYIKEANIARNRRRTTISNLSSTRTHEKMENVRRTVLNAVTLGRRKRAERALLESFAVAISV